MSRTIAKAAIGLSCVMMLAAMAGCAGSARRPEPPTLTVMTYNVYVPRTRSCGRRIGRRYR